MLVERMQHYVFPASLGTVGTAATYLFSSEGGVFLGTAVTPGAAGNLISFAMVSLGNNQPFSVTVIGNAITVGLQTDNTGLSNGLSGALVTFLNSQPAVTALATFQSIINSSLEVAFPPSHFTGGTSGAAAQSLQQWSLVTDLDAPFRLFGVVLWNLSVPNGQGFDGQVSIRFNRPDGRLIQRLLTSSNLLYPGNRYNIVSPQPNRAMCSPIFSNVIYPPGSTITLDLTALPSGSTANFIIVFVGTKLFQQGDVWAPSYPANWAAKKAPLSYLDNLTLQSFDVTRGPLLNQYFTPQQQDADFVWQAGAYTDYPVGSISPACQLVDLGVIIRDQSLKPYSNGYVPVGLLWPFLGCENPGFLYPEIYIPRNEQMSFDFNYLYPGFVPTANPITVVLGLKGMKVFPQ